MWFVDEFCAAWVNADEATGELAVHPPASRQVHEGSHGCFEVAQEIHTDVYNIQAGIFRERRRGYWCKREYRGFPR